ncbi:MAG: cytochrome c [Lewinellaceae bacterium]|nr:cytochrome c [Saprospiraceae bacterium]MCB9339961.1 cytochrome c [Lewinellaceae bacterium]
MKSFAVNLFALLLFFAAAGCGGDSSTAANDSSKPKPKSMVADEPDPMENKGIGPITSVTLGATVDAAMAEEGRKVYEKMCTACHKPTEKFIGPAPIGVLDRRSPEWIMNMILNPEQMVKEDPIAKKLLMEFNGSPMANQHLTEQEARAVLEYFRTL